MAGVDNGTLYHLVQEPLWNEVKAAGKAYRPPTYEQDGFIHLTQDPTLLIGVANHFYRQVDTPFLLLALDSTKLTSKVIFEAAAPVGSTPAKDGDQLFPHLYGDLNLDAVTQELPVLREPDGTFVSIQGLGA